MSARSKARKAAIDILFAADLRKTTPNQQELALLGREMREYTDQLITGVDENRRSIDSYIHTYAQGWDMDRLPAMDRNILRIAIYEMLWGGIDHPIAISEAVKIAESFSTENSAKFLHGILGRISVLADTLPR